MTGLALKSRLTPESEEETLYRLQNHCLHDSKNRVYLRAGTSWIPRTTGFFFLNNVEVLGLYLPRS
eukprot:421863-Pelagomonas_calceolata.AAC.1